MKHGGSASGSDGGDKSLRIFRELSPYLGLGIEIGGSMVLLVGLGYLADRWLQTTPLFILIGTALGFVSMVAQLIRVGKMADRRSSAQEGNATPPSSTEPIEE